MMRIARALLACVVLLGSSCASLRPVPPLSKSIERLIAGPPFDHAVWGIEIEDESGRVLYSHNGHVLMTPASNRKLFSAATDVNCLGPAARFETELWLHGRDAVIRGDGDPSFGSSRHESPGFGPFIAALRDRGVTSVHDVVADVSRFDRVTIPGTWKVGNLKEDYSAPVDALAWNENVQGDVAVSDPALYTATELRDALALAGIAVDGSVRVASTPECVEGSQCVRIASVASPFLEDLLLTVLKNSDNLYAEMLFKRSSSSGSYADSVAIERQFATTEAGIDPSEFQFVDGSGLSPDDLVAPAAIVKLFRWMNAKERRSLWWTVLAQPGNEGTLHRRLPELSERMRGKTGTINGVNALSGIVTGAHGGVRYFSVIVNHHTAESSEVLGVLDAIVREIASF